MEVIPMTQSLNNMAYRLIVVGRRVTGRAAGRGLRNLFK